MKRVGFVIVMALIALMLIGCNNAAGTGSIDDLNAPAVLSKIPLRVCIDNMQTSRTIFPNAWNDETAGKLIFILTGETVVSEGDPEILDLIDENLEEADRGKNNFTYAELTSGTLKVKISPLHWELTLTAYEKNADDSADETKKVLEDTIEVNLTSNASSQVAAFKMRPVKDENTESVGSIDLTLNFTKKDNLDRIEYGLYGSTTLDATVLDGKTLITAKAVAEEGVQAWSTVEGDKCQINFADSVNPGEYFFQARFYDSNDKLLAFYADNVYVDAANNTTKTINLADIINTPPIAPSNFNVSYKFNGGTNQEIATNGSVLDYYLATFTWEDNSNNELGFILDLTESVEEGATNYQLTNVSEAKNEADADFGDLISIISSSSSLKPSSTTCTVKLPTGKKYTATICAVNDFVAEDDYVTVACADGIINMFTVTYDLNSGYVQKSATEKTSTEIVKYAIAYEDKTEAQTLLPGSTGATYPSVRYDGNGFEYWLASSGRVNEIPENNTSNIDVKAVWTNSLTVQMTLPDYSGFDVALVDSYDQSKIYQVNAGGEVKFTATSDFTPTSWTVTYNGTTITGDHVVISDDLTTLTIDTSDMTAATYGVMLKGTKAATITEGQDESADVLNLTGMLYFKVNR